MVKHEFSQNLELCDSIVGAQGSLSSFHSLDTHSHVRSVDHVHVVGAISNAQSSAPVFPH